MDATTILRFGFLALYAFLGVSIPLLLGYILLTRAGLEAFLMGVTNLFRSPLRTILTMFGIIIGVAAVVSVISMGDGAREMVRREVMETGGTTLIEIYKDAWDKRGGSTITSRTRGEHRWRRNRARPLDYTDFENIKMMLTEAKAVSAEDDFGWGVIIQHGDREKSGPIVGVTSDYEDVYNWQVASGRFFDDNDLENATKSAILGSKMAKDLFGNVNPIGSEIRFRRTWGRVRESIRLQVIGVMEEKGASPATEGWDDRVLIPLTAFHARVTGNREVERMRIKAPTVEDVPRTIARVKQIIARRHDDPNAFQYWTASQEIATAERLGTIMKLVMGVIAGIALVVAGIGIMNIMLVSVTERTQEIGLRKALGATRRDVLFQFLVETAVMSIVGGLMGTGFGVLLGKSAASYLQRYVLNGSVWPSVVSPTAAVIAVSIAFLVGIVSGVYPANRAAKLTPVEALRSD